MASVSRASLTSRNVFIDAEAFRRQQFRFDHATLRRIRELGASGKLRVLSTEVVVGEVESNINEGLARASKGLKEFREHAAALQVDAPQTLASFFKSVEEEELYAAGRTLWQRFLTDAKVEVLGVGNVSVQSLLQMYFAGVPPFGPGKKKEEFPDAISVLALQQWAEDKGERLYVVSGDGDIKNWCETYQKASYVRSLGDFLDLYNRAEARLTEFVHSLIEANKKDILGKIEDAFYNCGFEYADNHEAEVTAVRVLGKEVLDVNVISVVEREAEVSIQTYIQFEADISGPDYDGAWWDSEEKRYAYLPTFEFEAIFDNVYDVSLKISYDIRSKAIGNITEILFDGGKNVTIYGQGDS